MKIEGSHRLEAPRDTVWRAVLDADVLAKVLPGCEDFRQTDDNVFAGILNIKVGPVQGKFKGTVTLSDLDPPNGYRLTLKGQGAPGFVRGSGTLALAELDDGAATEIRYDIDAQVGGRIASVGQRLLDSSARVVTRQALEGLDSQIAARHALERAEAEHLAAEAEAEALDAPDTPGPSDETTPQINGAGALHDPTDRDVALDPPAAHDAEQARRRAEARERAAAARERAEAARRHAESLEAPSAGTFAWQVARGMVRELGADDGRRKATVILAAAVLLGLLILFKSC
ncbi:MAG: carbon monoxide dehydrogenase subunit G [Acidobacteriota bacterium]